VAILLPPELTGEALLERQLQLAEELAALAGVDVQVTILNRAPPFVGLPGHPRWYFAAPTGRRGTDLV
jgi:hypothetical protein